MRTVTSLNTPSTMAAAATTTTKPIFPPPTTVQRSPWHSPMPYLFGGLAAMLGLIAIALLILACSFRRLSRRQENGEHRDLEAGGDEKPADSVKALPEFEEKYLVIMAGDVNPTFLATPVCSKACNTFGEDSKVKREEMEGEKGNFDNEKAKQDMGYEVASRTEEGTEPEPESENPARGNSEQNHTEEGTESESENRAQENSEQNH